jgi:hypothetical protein
MRYARHFVKRFAADIKSKCKIWKILIAFADDFRWIRRCIFEIAHVSYWTIFEAFSWIISISSIFLN